MTKEELDHDCCKRDFCIGLSIGKALQSLLILILSCSQHSASLFFQGDHNQIEGEDDGATNSPDFKCSRNSEKRVHVELVRVD